MPRITFGPDGASVDIASGRTVHEAAMEVGVSLVASCGGRGRCGTCRVEVVSGDAPPLTDAERALLDDDERAAGIRLACEIRPASDLEVRVLPSSRASFTEILADGECVTFALDSSLSVHRVTVEDATLERPVPDLDRLAAALGLDSLEAGAGALRSLPRALRAEAGRVTALLRGKRLIDVRPGDAALPAYGAAFDIGTTTVAGSMIDLTTGDCVATANRTNPQQTRGDDVISRMDYAAKGDAALRELQTLVANAIDEMLVEMSAANDAAVTDIYEITVAGNSVMTHLFLGLPPQAMAVVPFAPVTTLTVDVSPSDVSLHAADTARVRTVPLASAYVGGDIVAGALAVAFPHLNEETLFIDIGTNGEVVVGSGERAVCAATAAGPAFEGAGISCGMRAVPGAIIHVEEADGGLVLDVMGDEQPAGFCGTGLVDIVAVLVRAGVIDETGHFEASCDSPLASKLRETDDGFEFVVASGTPDLVLTQRDVRELQLAKGAIAAGATVLMSTIGLEASGLARVMLAGAFGSTIDPASAVAIGLLPPGVDPARVVAVGNTAAAGSRAILCSRKARNEADHIARWMKQVELSTQPEFQMQFAEAMMFPPPRAE
jgi:uncharacterized 2Fe-2S/4Fe-4S cluster protein (DUF4445 family)